VRLWVDDAAALAWMAPQGQAGVELVAWTEPAPDLEPGDVVVEAFGCDPPAGFVRRMAGRATPPPWINLEYLSAEAYVERSHGLPSPVDVQGRLLTKHFFYPGFTARSAGLLREPGLLAARQAFDREAWQREFDLGVQADERLVSMFCYDNPALAGMLDLLGKSPTLLLAAPGAAAEQVRALLGPTLRRGALRARLLPFLPQRGYDQLLWACDLNFVRGEDSFVRAQWAGNPFVWQIYPQQDGAHARKLHAFLDRQLAGVDDTLAGPVRAACLGWNALAPLPAALPPLGPWRQLCEDWRDRLREQPDLSSQLLGFIQKLR
jgi:uncharacterized repeat protein (TIGR03837 family)